jgi:hypothetical protein
VVNRVVVDIMEGNPLVPDRFHRSFPASMETLAALTILLLVPLVRGPSVHSPDLVQDHFDFHSLDQSVVVIREDAPTQDSLAVLIQDIEQSLFEPGHPFPGKTDEVNMLETGRREVKKNPFSLEMGRAVPGQFVRLPVSQFDFTLLQGHFSPVVHGHLRLGSLYQSYTSEISRFSGAFTPYLQPQFHFK